jgi:hypothetical protein
MDKLCFKPTDKIHTILLKVSPHKARIVSVERAIEAVLMYYKLLSHDDIVIVNQVDDTTLEICFTIYEPQES